MKKTAVILFVKYPEKGKVKTRLSKDINSKTVSELYKCFVKDILKAIQDSNNELIIYYTPSDYENKFIKWLGNNINFFPQNGENLGSRMKNAFKEVFNMGYEKAIVVGSDIPCITKDIINDSIKLLDENNCVIGPTKDGGYYLIGFNKKSYLPEIFKNIKWSSEVVFEDTINILKKFNYSFQKAKKISDIDNINDLREYIKQNNTITNKSFTFDYIKKNLYKI